MKKDLLKLVVLGVSASLALTSCSTNTQQQNTAVGAVSGAAVGGLATGLAGASGWGIAGGAIVGALIGGVIGHNMDSSDTAKTYTAMDTNPMNQPTVWKNERTGTVYHVIPTSAPMTINGNSDCRRYRATAYHHGKKHHFYGTACRQADGSWRDLSH